MPRYRISCTVGFSDALEHVDEVDVTAGSASDAIDAIPEQAFSVAEILGEQRDVERLVFEIRKLG